MAKFPALPLWTDALIGDTYHLTPTQFGAYLRLLIVEWRTPDCSLPNDDVFLGRSIGDPKNWHRLKEIVMAYFTLGEDGRYRQKRLLDERDSCARWAVKSSAGGNAKALKRFNRDSVNDMPNACQTPAPIPISIPIPNKESKNLLNGFVVGKKRAGNGSVTISDPNERLNRFQKKLALSFREKGWEIVGAAADPTSPNHVIALETCKTQARLIGKGWPKQWPTATP